MVDAMTSSAANAAAVRPNFSFSGLYAEMEAASRWLKRFDYDLERLGDERGLVLLGRWITNFLMLLIEEATNWAETSTVGIALSTMYCPHPINALSLITWAASFLISLLVKAKVQPSKAKQSAAPPTKSAKVSKGPKLSKGTGTCRPLRKVPTAAAIAQLQTLAKPTVNQPSRDLSTELTSPLSTSGKFVRRCWTPMDDRNTPTWTACNRSDFDCHAAATTTMSLTLRQGGALRPSARVFARASRRRQSASSM